MKQKEEGWIEHSEFSWERLKSARRHARNLASEHRMMTRIVRTDTGWSVLVHSSTMVHHRYADDTDIDDYRDEGDLMQYGDFDDVEPSDKDDEARQDILDEIYGTQDERASDQEDGWPY